LSLIDAPEEKLIDCNDGRSAPCDGDAGAVADAQDRVRVTRRYLRM
jgi:hypothetical protein